MSRKNVLSNIRSERLPTQWCAGCGIGKVLHAVLCSIEENGWKTDKPGIPGDTVFVSGIGCSGRTSSYIEGNTVHTLHGRALPFAEGIKVTNPDKHVVVVSGDGDLVGIGLEHFCDTCQSNVDMTCIVINNFTYAMTNSQASPSTPMGMWSSTFPGGAIERPIDVCKAAIGHEATFVARGTTLDVPALVKLISAGFKHHGFSVIEVFSACPENFGKHNDLKTIHTLNEWIRTITVPKAKYDLLGVEERKGKFPTGILHIETGVPEYCDTYAAYCASSAENAKAKGVPASDVIAPVDEEPPDIHIQLRFTGVGGQGVISAAAVLSRALVESGYHARMTKTFTPQVTLGSTMAGVVAMRDEIYYPYPIPGEVDFLLSIADLSYHQYKDGMKPGGTIVIDPNLVHPKPDDRKMWKIYEIPVVEIAQNEAGDIRTQSTIALAIAVRMTGCVSKEKALSVLLGKLGKKSAEVNKKAFEFGLKYADEALKSRL